MAEGQGALAPLLHFATVRPSLGLSASPRCRSGNYDSLTADIRLMTPESGGSRRFRCEVKEKNR
jgi:hypothetical protein